MSNQNIPLPPEYKNRDHGRVLQDIFNPAAPTGFVYEQSYNKVRQAFEDLRNEDRTLFKAAVDYIVKGVEPHEARRDKINQVLNAQDVTLLDDVTQKIVKDWQDKSYDASYAPKFMLDVGRPVSEEFYTRTAEKVNKIREDHPEFSQGLDQLIKGDTSGKSLVFAEKWYKDNISDTDGIARRFARAVRPVSGLEIHAARAYVERSPAPGV